MIIFKLLIILLYACAIQLIFSTPNFDKTILLKNFVEQTLFLLQNLNEVSKQLYFNT